MQKLVLGAITLMFFTSIQAFGNDSLENKGRITSITKIATSIPRTDEASIREWCRGASMEAFDPNCLSDSQAEIVLHVTIAPNGVPKYEVAKSVNCIPQDIFYCEQAIWEAAPALSENWAKDFAGTHFTCDFKTIPEKEISFSRWKHMYPQGNSKIVVIHFVPLSIFRRCSALLGVNTIEEPKNIVRIRTDMIDSPVLNAFRHDWVSFISNRITVPELETRNKIAEMREKYCSLFEPADQKK
jgi:hypothetical protein